MCLQLEMACKKLFKRPETIQTEWAFAQVATVGHPPDNPAIKGVHVITECDYVERRIWREGACGSDAPRKDRTMACPDETASEHLARIQALQEMVLAAARLRQRVLDPESEPITILAEPLAIVFAAAHPPALDLEEQEAVFGVHDNEVRFSVELGAIGIGFMPGA
ncbi:Hypothetical Protein RSKD131_4113 [Cereibacter sphaeroides KD131]|nr:Hypothetical Protein RSKD131_4113 [Cereibacter sphaeroides KD131]